MGQTSRLDHCTVRGYVRAGSLDTCWLKQPDDCLC